MGQLKAKRVTLELGTVQQAFADLIVANGIYDKALKDVREGATSARLAVGKYEAIVKDCTAIISKAKEIGADAIIKDVTDTLNIAKKNLKLSQDLASSANV